MQPIENERMSTFGSNQSQQGLQNSANGPKNRFALNQSWLLWMSEKFSLHILNLIRICFCITIGLVLASRISQKGLNQISNGIIASNDILLNKSLRGVFPPLDGTRDQLYGKWDLSIVTSVQSTSARLNKYSLFFKRSGDVQITNKNCKGDIKANWYIFYYNIGIKQKQTAGNQEMEIPNQKQDVLCIENNGQFMHILFNVSIWTIHLDNLYMIAQVKNNRDGNIQSYMLIFKKTKNLI